MIQEIQQILATDFNSLQIQFTGAPCHFTTDLWNDIYFGSEKLNE